MRVLDDRVKYGEARLYCAKFVCFAIPEPQSIVQTVQHAQ